MANILVSLLGSDYVINILLISILSGALVKIIASIAHFLVVERSYHVKYTVAGFAANKLLIEKSSLQFTRFAPSS